MYKNLLFKKLHKFGLLIILIYPLCQNNQILTQENKIHNLPLDQVFNKTDILTINLTPMPVGDIGKSSNKVIFDRNPFQELIEKDLSLIDNLYSNIRFKGLAKSGNNLFAIIENNNIQKFYRIGDSLDNGFVIKFISLENNTVDISNGFKNYRLTLVDLEKII